LLQFNIQIKNKNGRLYANPDALGLFLFAAHDALPGDMKLARKVLTITPDYSIVNDVLYRHYTERQGDHWWPHR